MNDPHYARHLKTNSADLPIDLVLRSPITILNGVGTEAAAALKFLEIHTVFDLAYSRIFNNAYDLVFSSEKGVLYREWGLVPADVVDSEISATNSQIDWKAQPIIHLRGIGPNNVGAIEQHLSVNTIRDLALWSPFLAARQIVKIANGQVPSFIDEEIPQELVPKFNEYASEKIFYSIYVIDEGSGKPMAELRSAIALEEHLRLEVTEVPRTGAILRYEQSWTPVALTLGNLLHSLALAPGESTRIAIIDWTRRQGVRTTEDISQLEALSNSLMQTRSINEVTRAVAREAQNGFSTMNANSTVSNNAYSSYGLQNTDQVMSAVTAGVGAGATAGAIGGGAAGVGIGGASGVVIGGVIGSGAFSVPGAIAGGLIGAGAGGLVGVGAGALIGGTAGGVGAFLSTAEFGAGQGSSSSTDVDVITTTSSSGSRNVEAEMAQHIDDRTHQHASTSRNKHASIVQEISQQETENISTRVVTNYNHMHALTIQYFEVVQIYNVRTTLVQKQPCLYIPFLPIKAWNVDLIRLYRQQLLQAALNVDVAYALLSTEGTVTLYSPTFPHIPDAIKQQRLRNAYYSDQLSKARSLLNAFVSGNPLDAWRIPDHFLISFTFGTFMQGGGGPFGGLGNDYQLKYELVFHYHDGSCHVASASEGASTGYSGLAISKVSHVTYELTAKNPTHWNFANSLREPQYFDMTFILQANQNISWEEDQEAISYSAHYVVDPSQISGNKLIIPVLSFSKSMAMADLIKHLHENTEYYTGYLLRKKNNPLVRQILNHYSFNGKRLINQVDQEPVAISGNYLIFLLHEARETAKKGALARYQAGSVSKNSMVPVGTGGVFAEAVLGRANSAEKLDISRFWDWQDSPIPIVAPEIAPIQSGSRATPMDVRPGSLDVPLVQYVAPNALPAPQSMPAILQTISTQMFHDMSGIAQTAQLAQKALESATEGATATGEQAAEGLKQGLDLTKELMGKIIDMNSQFAQLIANSGVQTIGVAAGQPLNLGNSSPSAAGLLKNWGEELDSKKAKEKSSGASGTPGGVPAGTQDSSPPAGGSTPQSDFPSNLAPGTTWTSNLLSGSEQSHEVAAFENAIGKPGLINAAYTPSTIQASSRGSLWATLLFGPEEALSKIPELLAKARPENWYVNGELRREVYPGEIYANLMVVYPLPSGLIYFDEKVLSIYHTTFTQFFSHIVPLTALAQGGAKAAWLDKVAKVFLELMIGALLAGPAVLGLRVLTLIQYLNEHEDDAAILVAHFPALLEELRWFRQEFPECSSCMLHETIYAVFKSIPTSLDNIGVEKWAYLLGVFIKGSIASEGAKNLVLYLSRTFAAILAKFSIFTVVPAAGIDVLESQAEDIGNLLSAEGIDIESDCLLGCFQNFQDYPDKDLLRAKLEGLSSRSDLLLPVLKKLYMESGAITL